MAGGSIQEWIDSPVGAAGQVQPVARNRRSYALAARSVAGPQIEVAENISLADGGRILKARKRAAGLSMRRTSIRRAITIQLVILCAAASWLCAQTSLQSGDS